MKQPLLLLCFLALLQTQKSYGQDSTTKVSVLVSPAVFVPVSVAAQVGFNVQVSKSWSLLAEVAYPTFYPQDEVYEKIRYWRTGLEVRHYLPKKKFVRYIALQNNYLSRQLTNKEDGLYYTKKETFAYSNAVIKSPVLSTAIKIGVEVPLGKRTYFDLFAGGGVRMIFTRYQSATALVTSIKPEEHDFLQFDDAWSYNYTLKRVHATVGVRFGIWL